MMENELSDQSLSTDAVIAGAGLIGLSIAWELTRQGARVHVLDASAAAGEASWAGAGMLTAGSELRRRDPWLPLGLEGAGQYPEYVARLTHQTGSPIDYRRVGLLELAQSEEEFQAMRQLAVTQAKQGLAVEVVDAGAIPGIAPALAPGAVGAVYYPDDALVDPRHLTQALLRALSAQQVEVQANCKVESIEARDDSCMVHTSAGSLTARCAIVASGAWSSSIPVSFHSQPLRLPTVTPVKGHLIGFDCEPGLLPAMVRQGSLYLLQRANGFLIAGSNEERVRFDRSVDPQMVEHLTAGATRLLPALSGKRPREAWIGFRPAVRRGAFPVNQWVAPTVCLAYGHFRNGILMAPPTARRIASEFGRRWPS